MVWAPLKSSCTVSGYWPRVPSAQPPPFDQLTPARSALLMAVTGNAALYWLEAVAKTPRLARATLVPPDVPPTVHASISVTRERLASAAFTTMRIFGVVTAAKDT